MQSTNDPTVAELVKAFANAAPDRLDDRFHELVAAVWQDGVAVDLALSAVPTLVDQLDPLQDDRKGRLVVLLGLLAETEYPATDGPVTAAVREGLDCYLSLAGRATTLMPLTLALLYLLGHFPADRERILAAVADRDLDVHDRSRLERALADLDPRRPDLGRCWPAPSLWPRRESEQEYDANSIGALTPEQVRTNWANDTRTVFGFSGAKGYWAACHGEVLETADGTPPIHTVAADPEPVDLLTRHARVFRCTGCHGTVELADGRFRCAGCGATFALANGVLDLSAGVRDGAAGDGGTADLLQKLSEMPGMGSYYESFLRPAFLQIAGSNWDGAVTPALEDEYLRTHITPVEGPVLDVAAGAGRWTTTIAETVGAERLVALDMGLPMLSVLRDRLPDVPAVQGSALDLPFGDATFGAVTMWNALQAFPDDAATAIAEVGRVLKPGGTFTMLTFLFDSDPIAAHFQASHYFPSRVEGMLLFALDELETWLTDAGLRVREHSGPGSFVLITAERVS